MAEAVQRGSLWTRALACVIAIELLGGLSGWISKRGDGTEWFDMLRKPAFMPPCWTFAVVWPLLYAMLGVALAMVLAEPSSDRRRFSLILFFIQLALNFASAPPFFAAHDILLAKWVVFIMAAVAAAAAGQFLRLRRDAGMLMVPYLGWLVFAATLNSTIEILNPGAGNSLLG